MYSDFEKEIYDVTKKEVIVKKCFFTKIGGGIFSSSKICSNQESLETLKSLNFFNDIENITEKELIEALEKNSNIFNIKKIECEENIHIMHHTHLGKIIETTPITMDLNLPKRLGKYKDLSNAFKEKFAETFKVIVNGSTFICYKDIQEFNALSIGIEFREIYKEIINRHFKCEFKVQPPCPFRKNYYIMIIESEDLFKDKFVSIHRSKSNIYILVNNSFIEGNISEEELISRIMRPISNQLYEYYRLKSLNQLIDKYIENVNHIYNECTKNYSELTSISSYNLFKYSKLKKKLKKQVFLLHNYYLEAESYLGEYDIKREQLLESISKNPILKIEYDDFKRETSYENKLSNNLLNILSYFSEELRNHESTRIAIICSIMGASLGATATLLAK